MTLHRVRLFFHLLLAAEAGAPTTDNSSRIRKRSPDIGERKFRSSESSRLTILAGCLACRLPECSCEVGLAGKAQRKRYVDQRAIVAYQKRFRSLKAPGADVAMWRLPDGLPEGSREMKSAQTRNRGDAIDAEIAFEVCFDVVQHTKKPASIQPFCFKKWI